MRRVSTRAPRVEIRRRMRADGSVSEVPTVRYVNALGERKRLTCSSLEEAELGRARLALDLSRGKLPEPDHVLTVAGFWPVWRADADARLAEATLVGYDRLWRRLVGPRFGDVALADVRPRMVAAWRGELLGEGIGKESVRMAMVLLQAMSPSSGARPRPIPSRSCASRARAASGRYASSHRTPSSASARPCCAPAICAAQRW